MRYKSEDGTTLDRINQGFRVANEIFMDNARNQTSYNTEMQRVARLERMEFQTTELYSPSQKNLKLLLRKLRESPREEDFIGIYPRGSGTLA